MKRLSWRQWVLVLAFLLAALGTGLFATRAVRRAVYWQTHRDEPIKPWMSVRYVARSYRVPPYVLYQAIRLEPRQRDRRPLREIAREQNRSVEELIAELQEAIKHSRPPYPPPPPPPPDRGQSP
jgi:hypothetical protein